MIFVVLAIGWRRSAFLLQTNNLFWGRYKQAHSPDTFGEASVGKEQEKRNKMVKDRQKKRDRILCKENLPPYSSDIRKVCHAGSAHMRAKDRERLYFVCFLYLFGHFYRPGLFYDGLFLIVLFFGDENLFDFFKQIGRALDEGGDLVNGVCLRGVSDRH